MIDAPVSGGEIGAINAQLSIMVRRRRGGVQRASSRSSRCMGNPEKIVHIGRSGAGQICKVCNQIAIGGALAGVSEAFALAKKAGVDAARVRQALLGGFAASRVLEVHGERMLTDNYKPGFRAAVSEGSAAGERSARWRTASPCRPRRRHAVRERARGGRRRRSRLRGGGRSVVCAVRGKAGEDATNGLHYSCVVQAFRPAALLYACSSRGRRCRTSG